MIRSALQIWWLIVPISVVTAILETFVPMTADQAAGQSKAGTFFGFLVGGLIFGVIAIGVYLWLNGRWPDNAVSIYRWLAVGLTVALTIAALVMSVVVKNWTGPVLWTAMNILWGVGYGWMIPLLIR